VGDKGKFAVGKMGFRDEAQVGKRFEIGDGERDLICR
jgi:hypothetical protein